MESPILEDHVSQLEQLLGQFIVQNERAFKNLEIFQKFIP